MKSLTPITVITVALLMSADVRAESAQDLLEEAWDKQVDRWEGLDSYLVEQTVMGHSSKQYFVRTSVTEADGESRTIFLPAPASSVRGACVKPISSSSDSPDKGDDTAKYMSWFINNAELVGKDTVGDRAALQFRADGLEETQSMNGEEVTMKSMSMWLSEDDFLHLKTSMEGVATIQGKSRPITIDTINSDFRSVSGSQLREPFRRVVNISGMMDGIDAAQVAQAQQQMAEFEKQMASMPESQRAMMEQMMGPRLEAMRKMTQTGGFETEVLITSIAVNPEVGGNRVKACD